MAQENKALFIILAALAIIMALSGGLLVIASRESSPEPGLLEAPSGSQPEPVMADRVAVGAQAAIASFPEPATTAPSEPLTQMQLPAPLSITAVPTNEPTVTLPPSPTPMVSATPEASPTRPPAPQPQVAVATLPPPTATEEKPCVLVEENGLLLVDVESAPAAEGWAFESSAAGYIGSGYYTWRGGNHFDTPGIGVLNYPIYINNPGTYLVRIHNYHDNPDSGESNDAWLQIGGIQSWIKTWSGDVNRWNWGNNFEVSTDNHREPTVTFGAPGQYLLQLSGRSTGFSIDRIAVTTENQFVPATDRSRPQSSCAP